MLSGVGHWYLGQVPGLVTGSELWCLDASHYVIAVIAQHGTFFISHWKLDKSALHSIQKRYRGENQLS